MTNDETRYEAWKAARALTDAPDDFADGVMAGIAERSRRRGTLTFLTVLAASRIGRVALFLFACAAFVFRVVSGLGVFITS